MKLGEILKYLIPIFIAIVVIYKCSPKASSPGLEYMPDMTHSKAYETYTPNANFANGRTAQQPPKGTVARGQEVFMINESPEGYNESSSIENPVEVNDDVLARGKEVYTIYCAPCHGPSGDGQGSVVTGSDMRYAPPTINFNNLPGDLTDGKMFYSITYGKNLMGAYASQVIPEDRWNVIHYIRTMSE